MLRFLLKSVIWAVDASVNTPERKGARGERKVHNALTEVIAGPDYKVFSDLILPTARGTTQIDHLIISRFGIFVIETKNMSGWIFGSADQRKWTQVHKVGKRRSFQNPLQQNYAHIKAVQEILQLDQHIFHNLVAFTGTAEPKTAMPDSVAWGLKDLGKLIAQKRIEVLSDANVQLSVNTLQRTALENTKAARDTHIQNLKNNAEAKKPNPSIRHLNANDQTSCPKCGANMLKRTNRKSGEAFLGCSRFPKCNGTRQIS